MQTHYTYVRTYPIHKCIEFVASDVDAFFAQVPRNMKVLVCIVLTWQAFLEDDIE